jgi:TPP-dependent pyruvate/acetoin dehydrogenase alpha subunit
VDHIGSEGRLGLFRQLVLNRKFKEKTIELYKKERIPELPHSNMGQEAIGVGACYGLNEDDYVLPSSRTPAALLK